MSEEARDRQHKADKLQSHIHTERENFLEQKEKLLYEHEEQKRELMETLERERNIYHLANERAKKEISTMKDRLQSWDLKHAASKHLTRKQVGELQEAYRKECARTDQLGESVQKLESQIAKLRGKRDATNLKATVQEKRADAVITGMDALRNKVNRLEMDNDALNRAKRGLLEDKENLKQKCERMSRRVEHHDIAIAESREKQARMKEQIEFAHNEVEAIRVKANDAKKRLYILWLTK